ncbi:hypothetical protein SLEP1_g39947 [Rubroshorea leprosula]|uniref:Glycosyltransferase n=1 Tax=Rubroshorea leprosula TaxID=152421 RepID=A0AAV5L237_9ROSI|nr:hypothetical protein SLEP1_g39947 [Rubroshorea leprosula]
MEEAIVLYPSPQIGHLISMVELGKLILNHQPSLRIHILNPPPPYGVDSTAPYISAASGTIPSITFHQLPTITLSTSSSRHHESFIMDFFNTPAFDVAFTLNIPAYYFFTSGAGALALLLYIPTIHKNTTKSFKDLDAILDFPAYRSLQDHSEHLRRARARPLKATRDGQCVPDGPTAPIHCVGQLIATSDRGGGSTSDSISQCLTWLNSQPSKSVVFLCFGSLGLFSVGQLKEIAVGLEKSGQRFLWVVRNPPTENPSVDIKAPSDPDLNSLLPERFLERTKQKGLVVKSWAPQVEVLNHDSVGGFVTHCGWNSILEAVCAGVPMVAWPLYAEQRLNRVLLVEEIKIALPIVESENGFVNLAEVEKRVRELMEFEEGKSIRERTVVMKHAAKAALSEGASSHVALNRLIRSWKQK